LVYIDEKSEKNINSIKISHDQELKDREYRISEAKKTAALLQEKADMVQNEAQKASLEAQQKIADITLAHTQETQKIALTAAQEAAVRAAEVASLQKELEMLKKSLISTPVGEVSIESIIPEASTEP
jgi:vacuolar-type H+-ATPase subunit D/Vma8